MARNGVTPRQEQRSALKRRWPWLAFGAVAAVMAWYAASAELADDDLIEAVEAQIGNRRVAAMLVEVMGSLASDPQFSRQFDGASGGATSLVKTLAPTAGAEALAALSDSALVEWAKLQVVLYARTPIPCEMAREQEPLKAHAAALAELPDQELRRYLELRRDALRAVARSGVSLPVLNGAVVLNILREVLQSPQFKAMRQEILPAKPWVDGGPAERMEEATRHVLGLDPALRCAGEAEIQA